MKVLDLKEMELVSGGFLPALAPIAVAAYPFVVDVVISFGMYSLYMLFRDDRVVTFDEYVVREF